MGKIDPPPLTNETIQQRLITGASSKGGARGSLTRCATKYGILSARIRSGGASEEDIQSLRDELKREVKLFQVEMHKWFTMIQSAEKELKDITAKEEAIAKEVEEKQQEIQELRAQAVQVARTRKCWQEYETLAKLARQRSPRRVLQAKMEKANADVEKTKKQLYKISSESKIREKQFHLLIQCMLDLKRSLGESIEIPPQKKEETEKEEEDDEKEEEVEKEQSVAKDDDGDAQPMETEEDEDDLYGGL